MKTITIPFLAALSFLVSPTTGSPQKAANQQSPCCQVVQEALEASGQLKMGMKRKDVEKQFQLDGGIQFRSTTRYMYARCQAIRVDVDFDFAPPTDRIEFSPDDTIVKVSTPYLAYPNKD